MKMRQIVILECGFSWFPCLDLLTYKVAESFGFAWILAHCLTQEWFLLHRAMAHGNVKGVFAGERGACSHGPV